VNTLEIFSQYIREHSHVDWCSWVIHDYVLARMKNDKTIQDKLKAAAKLIVEKMNYTPKSWQVLFEKMDAHDPEIFNQVPQIIYEYAEKHLKEATIKENLTDTIHSYQIKLASLYCYNRWKGDRVNCWILSETIKLCNVDKYYTEFYTRLFDNDPLLDNFQNDMLTQKKREINLKDSHIQWELNQADACLKYATALGATQSAYEALGIKLGLHDIWPPKKAVPFDINTVKEITTMLNEPELFRLYRLATHLDGIDPAKANHYAKLFIMKIKEILPKITSIKQEQAKNAYVS